MKRWILSISALLLLAVGGFFAWVWVEEWEPATMEVRSQNAGDTLRTGDTLKIVSWNIGYAGLGDDMDFFYDGGTRTRTSEERTRTNLAAITAFLQQHRDADFILLQEVDFDSRRSYRQHQYDSIRNALPEFMGWWGYNYVSPFVPIPLLDPLGGVRSGVVTLSRWEPVEVIRFQYPGGARWPQRMFDLKRCFLSSLFVLPGGGTFYLNNTHNSAFDPKGTQRRAELAMLAEYLAGKPRSVTLGDWNCNPPGYTPTVAEQTDEHFHPVALDRSLLGPEHTVVYDPTTPSMRFGREPYNPATTPASVIDFMVCGQGITPITFETVSLGFQHSDHNPVVATFVIN